MDDHREMTPERKQVLTKINQMMDESYGCAEAFIAAVGEYLWGELDDSIIKISTGFSGGVGGTHEELCGGVSGATIIMGLLYGRTTNDETKMIRCKRLISEHRDRFMQEFGTTVCQELRDAQFGADEENPCSAMIAPASFILLDILEEEKEREAQSESVQADVEVVNILSIEEYVEKHQHDDLNLLVAELQRAEIPHQYRDWIGIQLNIVGDNREGVGLTTNGLPDLVWQSVLEGNVDIERAGEFHVDELIISKYPLTAQQFQVFLDDPDGFNNSAWWEGLSVSDGHKTVPGEQRFQEKNHPRDNVSWYDAIAYCRWLNERLQSSKEVPVVEIINKKGWEIRLPTEWEWQMAATGGDPNNKFPWGLDWNGALAHTKHNQLNKSMAVGMYPSGVSPTGALDMSGNIWEWCLNCYKKMDQIDLERTDRRVLRGGSWYHWGSYAHSDMRSRYYPDHRYNAGGFRVACGNPLIK